MEEISLKDYVLTNINLNGYFTIRLTDNKEYIVYKGKNGKDYIVKDNKEIPLSKEVKNIHLGEVRVYQNEGI